MLIAFEELQNYIDVKNVTGVIHVGAHECEERDGYHKFFSLKDDKILWIEGIPNLCERMKNILGPSLKIVNAVISNENGKLVTFNITNNGQSSSILELEKHLIHHPHVYKTHSFEAITKTLTSVISENNFTDANFLNLDIQGAELLALQGLSDEYFSRINYIYTEVNNAHLYKDCALFNELYDFLKTKGFVLAVAKMTPYEWGDALFIRE